MEETFSVRSVPGLIRATELRVAVVGSEKLVADAGDILRTHRKGNVRRWKPLPSNG
jgi:hypothetical protein